MIVFLDTGVLGYITHPKGNEEVTACKEWAKTVLSEGHTLVVPEIADYELRRELIRAVKTDSVKRLDEFNGVVEYLPVTTESMKKAAVYWAQMRNRSTPTADDKALDGDVILCAQIDLYDKQGNDYVVATTNVGHLSRLVEAAEWEKIKP